MGNVVSFEIADGDDVIVYKIAKRARAMEKAGGGKPRSMLDWHMDIIATHANGNPLRLADLLAADDFNFAHDVYGICACLDRETGKLTRHFRPRFSVREAA